MIKWYKKRGETPLESLNRLRIERKEFANEILSYAGRLDPMAEGILPVLVGEEENKNRKEYLEKDKIYEAHFLIGCSTDTGDILGLIQDCNMSKIDTDLLISVIKSLVSVTEQTYPWYSSKTVDGIPLFEYARSGNFNIERPKRNVKIYSVSDVSIYELTGSELILQNIKDISNVMGDFRQSEICDSWNKIISQVPERLQIVSCVLKVSSGTYIRGLTEYLSNKLGVPVVLEKLIRTEVF